MPNEEKIVHCMGFDFDGCLLPNELGQSSISEANRALFKILKKQAKHAYASSIVLVSSSRQSQGIDEFNRKNQSMSATEDPTSCFIPLKQISENDLGSTLCPFLLADAYYDKPDGYAYTRAVMRAEDDTTYHPGYVFDTYKAGLIYTQVHTVANNVRNCDFLTLDSLANQSDLLKLPFKSNAAYVYDKATNNLYYVNKIEQTIKELTVYKKSEFNTKFLDKLESRIEDEEHDFDALYKEGSIHGITLSDKELEVMHSISQHRHIKKDYPIIFDFYDDLEGILSDLKHTFGGGNQALLPNNMTIRLNQYSVENPGDYRVYGCISGTGAIDLKPKQTLVKMAKAALGKDTLTDDDYDKKNDSNLFANFISSPENNGFFKQREVVKPTVKHQEVHKAYAPFEEYDSSLDPEDVREILALIKDLRWERGLDMTFFSKRKLIKMNVLSDLLTQASIKDPAEALRTILSADNSELRAGGISQRTNALLKRLAEKYMPEEDLSKYNITAPDSGANLPG